MHHQEPLGHASFHAILASLKTRSGMIEHLEGIDLDGDGLADIPLGPPPANPIARAHWRDWHARRQHANGRRSWRKEANNRIILNHLQAHDPLFETVHGKVLDFVRMLPTKLQRPILRAVEETPGAYLDLYEEMRGMLLHQGAMPCAVRKPRETQRNALAAWQDPREAIRQAVSGRINPAVLKHVGNTGHLRPMAARSAEREALKARCRAGKAQEGDLLRYIELSMPENPTS